MSTQLSSPFSGAAAAIPSGMCGWNVGTFKVPSQLNEAVGDVPDRTGGSRIPPPWLRVSWKHDGRQRKGRLIKSPGSPWKRSCQRMGGEGRREGEGGMRGEGGMEEGTREGEKNEEEGRKRRREGEEEEGGGRGGGEG